LLFEPLDGRVDMLRNGKKSVGLSLELLIMLFLFPCFNLFLIFILYNLNDRDVISVV
jgi:hypothetical protein